jgi:hypothetical protein
MRYQKHQHRFGLDIINSDAKLSYLWTDITKTLDGITDERIIEEYELSPNAMSISAAINNLIDQDLQALGWTPQSAIFQGSEYEGKSWRLDFAKTTQVSDKEKSGIAIEVAFNHGEAIAWNLLKPVLAAEINHINTETDIGVGVGVYICATESLKEAGAFDGAVGEYEKVLRYLSPLFAKLTVPMVIVGLEAPETFKVEKRKNPLTGKNKGTIKKII